ERAFIYGSIHNLYEGYYLTCKNTYGSFTADMGELVFDRETYNGIDGYGYLDSKGNPLTPQMGDLVPEWNQYSQDKKNFPFYTGSHFNEGVASVTLQIREKQYNDQGQYRYLVYPGLTGIMDGNGEILVDFIYDSVSYFSNGAGFVTKDDNLYLIANPLSLENGTITPPEEPSPSYTYDAWAAENVIYSFANGLVVDSLDSNFTSSITRLQIADLLVNMLEKYSGKTLTSASPTTFVDTLNLSVLKAYEMGIIKGKENNQFDPYSYATRQEIAVMIYNAIATLEVLANEDFIDFLSPRSLVSLIVMMFLIGL
ncbi:MAG: WG repeat-containing protein, partial [Eubacteriales bacterium]